MYALLLHSNWHSRENCPYCVGVSQSKTLTTKPWERRKDCWLQEPFVPYRCSAPAHCMTVFSTEAMAVCGDISWLGFTPSLYRSHISWTDPIFFPHRAALPPALSFTCAASCISSSVTKCPDEKRLGGERKLISAHSSGHNPWLWGSHSGRNVGQLVT